VTKLRTIRTTYRAASVKRSEVASAVKAVVAERVAKSGTSIRVRRDKDKTEMARK
jgi:hypothetical protein